MTPILLAILFASPPNLAKGAVIDRVVGAREHVTTAEDVKLLGSDASRILIGVASDAHQSRMRRVRAIAALRFAPSDDAREFLRTLLADKKDSRDAADQLELASGISALQPYGHEALAQVIGFLTHNVAAVRQAAAVTLGMIRAPESQTALRTRLYLERDAGVRNACARALQNLTEKY